MSYDGGHSTATGEDYTGKGKKPCRTCWDFKSWMRQQGKLQNTDSNSSQMEKPSRPDCPVDKDELGRASWAFLHTMASQYPDQPTLNEKSEMNNFMQLFGRFYPCEPCADDFRRDIQANPPALNSRKDFSMWLCERHNVVNKKLGKTEFDCRFVDQRWKDGWADGSCG